MDTTVTIQMSALVAVAIEGIKQFGCQGRTAMLLAIVFSFVVVLLWAFSHETAYQPIMLWNYASAFMVISGTAIGMHSATKNTIEVVKERRDLAVDPRRFLDGREGTGKGDGTDTVGNKGTGG